MAHLTENCKGDDKKKNICALYDVQVISRIALMPGSTIDGCCGELENEHTIFHYKNKTNPKDEGTFSVGKSCAASFLKILNQKMPHLINPMQNIQIPGTGPGPQVSTNGPEEESDKHSSITAQSIPTINQELYTAINLFFILQNKIPKWALQRILLEIQNSPTKALDEKNVFDFIKVLAAYKKTLSDMIASAKTKHPQMKSYSFPTIDAIARKNWICLP
ncbi:hypothetical protein [Pseudomonas brassicacearum]|uniref:Uncharacterized protein n=1 Tax=Pseudomonas brassicacearum TaxID=930166 RepID=A0A423GKP1_9PSED|nr:hypothetical protein [Pseudomonas brassicacearum]ROM91082.1 hypothetical protein BK658_24620 [Pseudomonas brassicacearum]